MLFVNQIWHFIQLSQTRNKAAVMHWGTELLYHASDVLIHGTTSRQKFPTACWRNHKMSAYGSDLCKYVRLMDSGSLLSSILATFKQAYVAIFTECTVQVLQCSPAHNVWSSLSFRGSYHAISHYINHVFLLLTCCCSIDATDSHRLGKLINHSSKPNAKPRIVWLNEQPHICLFALMDIHNGDQILYNYGIKLPFTDLVSIFCAMLLISFTIFNNNSAVY